MQCAFTRILHCSILQSSSAARHLSKHMYLYIASRWLIVVVCAVDVPFQVLFIIVITHNSLAFIYPCSRKTCFDCAHLLSDKILLFGTKKYIIFLVIRTVCQQHFEAISVWVWFGRRLPVSIIRLFLFPHFIAIVNWQHGRCCHWDVGRENM